MLFRSGELKKITLLDAVTDLDGNKISDKERIFTGEWYRPVLKNNEITIFAEAIKHKKEYEWSVLSKEHIKRISD